MPKRRKTRQEKIILQLKRELAKSTKTPTRQEANFSQPQTEPKKQSKLKKTKPSAFSYDPKLIKHDLFKSLLFTLAILSFIFMLYLKLR